jgi:hypothetical protein
VTGREQNKDKKAASESSPLLFVGVGFAVVDLLHFRKCHAGAVRRNYGG